MDQQHAANATIISLLHDHLSHLADQHEQLSQRHRSLQAAQRYLRQLLRTIDDHPGLLIEWENFLDTAELGPAPPDAGRKPELVSIIDEAHHASLGPPPTRKFVSEAERFLHTQQWLIADLKEKAINYQKNNERLTEEIAAAALGRYYLHMQQRIHYDPLVMDAWKTFLMLITLTVDGPIQGITCDDHPRRRR